MPRKKKIVLASSSPRRRDILKKTGLAFTIDVSPYHEDMEQDLAPHELARALSLGKAEATAGRHKNAVIIAADTFIVHRGKLLGKPRSREEAMEMLVSLNGRAHSVITGFTIIDTGTEKRVSRSVETRVCFRRLSKSEIESYVNSGEPLNKAGAYAIQGLGSVLVTRIEGDYFNVMGLPISALTEELKKFGISVL